MLKRLRRKFILMNMAMVSVVVIAVFSAIGIISYQQSLSAVYTAMHDSVSTASQNPFGAADALFGSRRDFEGVLGDGSGQDRQRDDETDFASVEGDSTSLSQPLIGGDSATHVVPVAVYRVASLSSIQVISRASTASLSEDVVSQAVSEVYGGADGEGRLDDLGLFYVKETRLGTTYIGFASTSSATDWQNIVLMLVLVGAGTLLVFFAISVFFSRWALRPVEEAWGKQRQFLADASHELKTPLTVILANTDIILKHSDRSVASQEQWLESTQHEALGMQDMVLSMLDLARLDAAADSGSLGNGLSLERVNFSDLALGSLLQFESIAFDKQVNLVDDIDEDLYVMGDPGKLERLCGTLLDNACKYAPSGSIITATLRRQDASAVRADVAAVRQGEVPQGDSVVLTVANEGEPVDPEDLPHLFDRFYRSDKARTHESSGNSYGLGLAIAASTVAAHGGCISATSAEGEGTTFTVLLPSA